MKLFSILALCFVSATAMAKEIRSDDANAQVNIARVVKLVNLVDKPNIQVNIAVQDLGGSTDVSPTQKVFLTLYSKGEMFSTDAAFELVNVLSFESAKRVAGGIYEIKVREYNETIETVTYRIDARKAVTDIQKVQCEDFDCEASENFTSSVFLEKR